MTTQIFSYTGAAQTFTWPAGVTSAAFDVQGAGNDSGSHKGARVQATITKGAESTLQINVGAQGSASNTTVFGGGAAPGTGGSGFGGGTRGTRFGAGGLAFVDVQQHRQHDAKPTNHR